MRRLSSFPGGPDSPGEGCSRAWQPQDLAEIRRLLGPSVQARSLGTVARPEILVCMGGGCRVAGSEELAEALETAAAGTDQVAVLRVGCLGLCGDGPLVKTLPDGRILSHLNPEDADLVVDALADGEEAPGISVDALPFFALQRRLALSRCGVVAVDSLEEAVALGAYRAAALAVAQPDRRHLVEASFRLALGDKASHWSLPRDPCLVCHVGLGDPGAVGDIRLLEGDPHGPLEGLVLGALASGASHGYMVLPGVDTWAAENARRALAQARERELLGPSVLGSGLAFELHLVEGMDAAVTGDESALAAALEGRRPMPRPGPPALAGQPLMVANVEVWTKLGPLFLERSGVERSRPGSTRVLALAGDVKRRGVVEVPESMPLRQIVEDMGDPLRPMRAIHIGGIFGRLVGSDGLDQELLSVCRNEGSGTLVGLESTAGLVRVVRGLLRLVAEESCGKCPPCRVGAQVLVNGFEDLLRGDGDHQLLTRLARHVGATADCLLGRSAARVVLSACEELRPEAREGLGKTLKP